MIPATTNFLAKIARPMGACVPQYIITINGYSRAFTNLENSIPADWTGVTLYPWNVNIADYSYSVNDLEGGANVGNFSFAIQDNNASITGDFPTFTFEGSIVTVQMGFQGMLYVDYITVFQGYIDEVASANNNLEYQFSCLDFSGYLSQVIYTTADNGGVTSSTNIRTVKGNPLSILLDILQNQTGLAIGTKKVPLTSIDFTTINAYINGPFNGVEFVFHLTQAPAALDFIKAQLLKPLGGFLWVNSQGMLTVRFFYPLAGPVAVGTFDSHTWKTIPTAEQTQMVNVVEYQFDRDDDIANGTQNYLSLAVNDYALSLNKFGIVGEQVISADGMRSAFQGVVLALMVSRLIFLRYGMKSLKFDSGSAESHLDTCLFETGDIVSVTHPLIPDRAAGVKGITNKLFEILDKKWNFEEGILTFTMIDASYLSTFGFYEIAPSSEATYNSASAADQAKYLFQSTTLGKYVNTIPATIPANTLG
jgi:hypothetical protein